MKRSPDLSKVDRTRLKRPMRKRGLNPLDYPFHEGRISLWLICLFNLGNMRARIVSQSTTHFVERFAFAGSGDVNRVLEPNLIQVVHR